MVHVLFDHVNEAIICDGNQIFLLARRFKNPGIPTDYQKDSVSTPTSPSFLNRSDLTQLFAINPKNYSREKICRNCRLSLPNYVFYIHRLDQVYRSPVPVRCLEEVTPYLQSKEPDLHYAGSKDHLKPSDFLKPTLYVDPSGYGMHIGDNLSIPDDPCLETISRK